MAIEIERKDHNTPHHPTSPLLRHRFTLSSLSTRQRNNRRLTRLISFLLVILCYGVHQASEESERNCRDRAQGDGVAEEDHARGCDGEFVEGADHTVFANEKRYGKEREEGVVSMAEGSGREGRAYL